MDQRTFVGWQLKGMEGCLNILEMLVRDGVTFTPHFAEELDKQAERLLTLRDQVKVEE